MTRNSAETVPPFDSDVGRGLIILLYSLGFPQHRIAALFDVNSGRIAEAWAKVKDPGFGQT